MSYGQLFGRRIIVAVGDQIVVNLDYREGVTANNARNLHVDFSTSTHAKPEPLVADVTVKNLNRVQRAKFQAQQDQARKQAWQKYSALVTGEVLVEPDQVAAAGAVLPSAGAEVKIWAGYQDDFGLLHTGTVLPDGYGDDPDAPGYTTTFRSQDTRLAWANSFVSEEVAPGVSLVDYQKALAVAEGYLRGDIGAEEVQAQAPGVLSQKLDAFGYENGKVLHGQTRDKSRELMDTLGLRPFLVDGKPYYLPVDALRFDVAVVLRLVPRSPSKPAPGGLTHWKKVGSFYKGRCLLNHRMSAGRQVQAQDENGLPLDGGLFRVEHATHTGSSYSLPYYTDFVLRPVTISPENNG